MEIQGHEITVAKAATKKAKMEDALIAANPSNVKVKSVSIYDVGNVSFFLMVKLYEDGEILSKSIPKSRAMSTEWTALH